MTSLISSPSMFVIIRYPKKIIECSSFRIIVEKQRNTETARVNKEQLDAATIIICKTEAKYRLFQNKLINVRR